LGSYKRIFPGLVEDVIEGVVFAGARAVAAVEVVKGGLEPCGGVEAGFSG
jgi:hypothetical protein